MLLRLDLMALRALVIPIARLSDELARDLVDAAAAGDTRLARDATDPVRLHSIRRRVSELGDEWERLRSLVDLSADDLDLVRGEGPTYPPDASPILPIEPPPHPAHGGTMFVGGNGSNVGPPQSTAAERPPWFAVPEYKMSGSGRLETTPEPPSAELEAGRAAGLEAELALERLRDVVGAPPVPPAFAEEEEDTDATIRIAAAVLEGGEAPPPEFQEGTLAHSVPTGLVAGEELPTEARGGHVLEQRASLAEIAGVRCFVEGCLRPPVSGELACDWHVGV